MKKTFLLFILSFLLINISCDDDDAICGATIFADLLLEGYNYSFVEQQGDNRFYNLSHNILNSVADVFECREDVEAADPSTFRQQIEFSPNSSFSNAQMVDELDIPVQQLLAGSSADVLDEIAFLVDGFYRITSNVDYFNTVNEREESNNVSLNPVLSGTARPNNIIEIAGTRPYTDQMQQTDFIRRVATNVEYND